MIFFDFDGTLVDVWDRYHRAFSMAAEAAVPWEEYIRVKRKLHADGRVAEHFGLVLPADYWERKRELLESDTLLRLDTLLVSPEELLSFFRDHACRILTSRRRPEAFRRQLAGLGLEALADRSVVLSPDADVSKKEYIRAHHPHGSHVIIGDSQAEWEAASLPNVQAVLVSTGLCSPAELPPKERCRVLPSAEDFLSERSAAEKDARFFG